MTVAFEKVNALELMRAGSFLHRALIACAAIFVALSAGTAAAEADGDTAMLERRIKAAYLYKFAGYVEWPDGTFSRPDTPIVIAVTGDDQLADELARLVAGRTVDGHPVEIRRQSDNELAADVNVLFIARGEGARLRARGKLLRPILIVTESEDALAQGSAINFVLESGRVRFEVSPGAAERRHLKLSSRLITVALNMRTGAH